MVVGVCNSAAAKVARLSATNCSLCNCKLALHRKFGSKDQCRRVFTSAGQRNIGSW